ncbi:hypothetical protein [Bosea thiooxidans]
MDESGTERSLSAEGGQPSRYVQGIARRFRLTASELRFVGGYDSRAGRLEDGRRILAEAHVLDGTLGRAGVPGDVGPIGLTLRPLAVSAEETRLLLMLGYREAPFAEAFLAPAVFEQLKADMLAGLAQELSLSATTSLWVLAEDRAKPDGEPLDWYLGRDGDGLTAAPARGFIESISWWPRPMVVEPVAAPVHEHDEEDWHESAADELRRINWSFKLLLLLLVFLLLIVALR